MLPEKQNREIEKYFNQEGFVLATQAQISKDLQGLIAGDWGIGSATGATVLDVFAEALIPVLIELSTTQSGQLAQFIYRVDLGEAGFKESFARDPSLRDLAYRVVEREAQKVFLRLKFSPER